MSSHTSAPTFPKSQVSRSPYNPHTKPETVAKRSLGICLAVSLVFIIIVATVIVTLVLTLFKPKDPDVSVTPLGLENFEFFQPNVTKVPLDLLVTIVNPNYGSFRYKNSTGYLNYRDIVVAEVPFATKLVPARCETNLSATVGIETGKLESDAKFWSDIDVGALNFTAKATLPGKVIMMKIFKMKATVHISCDIHFKLHVTSMDADSSCIAKIKL